MTTQEVQSRQQRTIDQIRSMFGVHDQLRQYAATLQVTIENAKIVLTGDLPSASLRSALIPAVRQAGVLDQISNRVQVRG